MRTGKKRRAPAKKLYPGDLTPVARCRLEKGISPREVAKQAGVSYSYYKNVENGYRVPGLAKAIRIAKVLERPVEELFGWVADA